MPGWRSCLGLGLAFLCLSSSAFSAPLESATPPALRVGLTGQYPPFNYFDSKGKLTGFDVDIAEALCTRIHRKCVYKVLAWDGILAALASGKIDAVIGSMAITPEREKQALFTEPYYESGAQLFVRSADANPERDGFRIGVTLGTTYGAFAQKRFPRAEVHTYKGDVEVFQDLRQGRLDGAVTDRLVGAYINQQRKMDLALKGSLLFTERMGIPVRLDQGPLRDELNGALRELRASGTHSALIARYFGSSAAQAAGGQAPPAGGEASAKASSAGFDWANALSLMMRGLGMTIQVSAEGLALGSVLAVLFCFLMILPPVWIRVPVLVCVDFVRATPFMIQLFAIYFGLPSLGIVLNAWNAAVIAIALHLSAYLSEILKVAYLSVSQGQHHAARVLGLSRLQSMRHIIAPQMAPLLFAPALNTMVAMIKDSAIVSVISVHELTMQTQQLISATFRPIEFYAIAALLYALVTYPLLMSGRWLERRYKAKGLLHGEA